LKRYDRAIWNEIEGIAEGANISTEEIVFLNVRIEMMSPFFSKKYVAEGCTSFYLNKKGHCFVTYKSSFIK